jgi:hypothetical protein
VPRSPIRLDDGTGDERELQIPAAPASRFFWLETEAQLMAIGVDELVVRVDLFAINRAHCFGILGNERKESVDPIHREEPRRKLSGFT